MFRLSFEFSTAGVSVSHKFITTYHYNSVFRFSLFLFILDDSFTCLEVDKVISCNFSCLLETFIRLNRNFGHLR